MSEIALYRKYRPQDFEHLVGQDHVRVTLQEAVKKGEVAHAYLFSGPRGTGKTSAARILAKAINCTNVTADGNPCQTCDICEKTALGSLIDLIEIDAASNRGIDEMRDLRDKIKFAPSQARKKVYIIDEVHMLTKEAFNALLKTLEEPPDHVHFVLATTELHKVPETIISRCQSFTFHRIDDRIMVERLKFVVGEEKIMIDQGALDLVAKSSEGGLRDALGLLEQMSVSGQTSLEDAKRYLGMTGRDFLEGFLGLLATGEVETLLKNVNSLYQDGYDLRQFVKELIEFLRDELLAAVAAGQEVAGLIQHIELFQQAEQEMKFSTIPQLPLELAVIRAVAGQPIRRNVKSDALPSGKKSVSGRAGMVETAVAKAASASAGPAKVTANRTAPETAKVTVNQPEPAKLSAESSKSSLPKEAPQPLTTGKKTAASAPLVSQLSQPSAPQPLNTAPVSEKPSRSSTSQPAESDVTDAGAGLQPAPAEGAYLPLEEALLRREWAGIMSKMKPPGLRRSFEQGRLAELVAKKITLCFTSDFHLEKVQTPAHKEMLSRLLETTFGHDIELVFEKREIALQPADLSPAESDVTIDEFNPTETVDNNPNEPDKLANQALDIFGGELVEE